MKSVTTLALAIPILVLGLPIFDTLFAILRRISNGKPIGEDRVISITGLLIWGSATRYHCDPVCNKQCSGILSIVLVDKVCFLPSSC